MPYKQIITTGQVRRNLLGLQDELAACDQDEIEMLLDESLDAAQNEFEQDLQTWLYPRKIKTYPLTTDQKGQDYDEVGTPYDFYTANYARTGSFTLRHRPVQSIERMAVELSRTQVLFSYPAEWIRLNPKMGKVSIYPSTLLGSSLSLRVGNLFYLPSANGFFRDVSPLLVSIDYTAGTPDAESNKDFSLLRMRLAQAAGLLARDAIMERIVTSASREGIQTTFTNGQQQAQILTQKIADWKEDWRENNRPINARFA